MNIKLTDLGLNSDYAFYNTLLKYQIRTVEDLLNQKTIDLILSRMRSQQTRNELLGFVDLIRNRVEGRTLISDVYLDQVMVPLTDNQRKLRGQVSFYNLGYPINFSRMGFTGKDTERIYWFYITGHFENDIKLLDLFRKFILEHPNDFLSVKMYQYVQSYDNTRANDLLEQKLQDELRTLTTERDRLDEKIVSLQQRLEKIKELRGNRK